MSGPNIDDLLDALLSDGFVVANLEGVPFEIRFQSGFIVGPDQSEIAGNVLITLIEFANSPTGSNLIRDFRDNPAAPGNVIINIKNDPSGISTGGGWTLPLASVNAADLQWSYRVQGSSDYARFTYQHILNHELTHVLTDLDDGTSHNAIVNSINAETSAGPPRSDDYFDVIRDDFGANNIIDFANFSPDAEINRLDFGGGDDVITFSGLSAGVNVDFSEVDFGQGMLDAYTIFFVNTVWAFANLEVVEGSENRDTFRGQSATDQFFGLGGDDDFLGSTGSDTLVGGDGNDLVDYSGIEIGLSFRLSNSTTVA